MAVWLENHTAILCFETLLDAGCWMLEIRLWILDGLSGSIRYLMISFYADNLS